MAFMGFPDLSFIGRQRAEEAQQVGRGFGRLLGALIGRKIQERRTEKERERLLDALNLTYGPRTTVTSTQTEHFQVPEDLPTQAAGLPRITERDLMPETTRARAGAPRTTTPEPGTAEAAPLPPTPPTVPGRMINPGHAGLFSRGQGRGLDMQAIEQARREGRLDTQGRVVPAAPQGPAPTLNARQGPAAQTPQPASDLRAMLEPVQPRMRDVTVTGEPQVVLQRAGVPPALLAMVQGADLDTLTKMRTGITENLVKRFFEPPKQDTTLNVPELAVLAAQGDPTAIKALEFMQSFQQHRPYSQVVGFTADGKRVVSFDTRTKQVEVTPVPGGEGVTSRLQRESPQERETVAEEQTTINRLREARRNFQEGAVGPFDVIRARIGQFIDPNTPIGVIAEQFGFAANPEYAEWLSNLGRINAAARKELYGATLTAGEKAQFREIELSPSLSETALRARMDEMERRLLIKQQEREREQARAGVVRNPAPMSEEPEPVPLDLNELVEGKLYINSRGEVARYLGNGRFEVQD